jgi:hypothetical protein
MLSLFLSVTTIPSNHSILLSLSLCHNHTKQSLHPDLSLSVTTIPSNHSILLSLSLSQPYQAITPYCAVSLCHNRTEHSPTAVPSPGLELQLSALCHLEVPSSIWSPVPLVPSKAAEPLYDLPAHLPTAAANYNFLQQLNKFSK